MKDKRVYYEITPVVDRISKPLKQWILDYGISAAVASRRYGGAPSVFYRILAGLAIPKTETLIAIKRELGMPLGGEEQMIREIKAEVALQGGPSEYPEFKGKVGRPSTVDRLNDGYGSKHREQ